MSHFISVYPILFTLLKELSEKGIECTVQPTVKGHPVFTEFIIKLSSANKVAIVEVKKFSINCNMTLETTTETAQALREAHIMLTTSDMTTGSRVESYVSTV